ICGVQTQKFCCHCIISFSLLGPEKSAFSGSVQVSEYSCRAFLRIPLYSITDWHRSPISDSHPFDQPGT
ncbi:hypothetical protein, partial [Escherichia coli]|uniref:hypothetical protein n=1 Tax=Escherichia coli TaxID=562 RepID=UPI001BECADE3